MTDRIHGSGELDGRCHPFRLRLDAAGPDALTSEERAHAGNCEACAAELRAAEAVEGMLRATPPVTSAGFTASVMRRVEATERARQRLAEWPRPSAWHRWWRAVAEEPIAVATLAIAPVPILLAILWPGTAASLTAFVRSGLTAWVAAADPGSFFNQTGVATLLTPVREASWALGIAAIVVLTMLGFQWVGDGLGGSLMSARRAHSKSTSRRKPS